MAKADPDLRSYPYDPFKADKEIAQRGGLNKEGKDLLQKCRQCNCFASTGLILVKEGINQPFLCLGCFRARLNKEIEKRTKDINDLRLRVEGYKQIAKAVFDDF